VGRALRAFQSITASRGTLLSRTCVRPLEMRSLSRSVGTTMMQLLLSPIQWSIFVDEGQRPVAPNAGLCDGSVDEIINESGHGLDRVGDRGRSVQTADERADGGKAESLGNRKKSGELGPVTGRHGSPEPRVRRIATADLPGHETFPHDPAIPSTVSGATSGPSVEVKRLTLRLRDSTTGGSTRC
jgi:hypothetical protein